MTLRLGINIDHVATLRNARGGVHPDVLRAALMAQEAGADGLTVHLREDRRHIRDADVCALKEHCTLPMTLEMAATDEMQAIALKTLPNAVCLVPESREELTTEGGLNVVAQHEKLTAFVAPLRAAEIRISLFIDPDIAQLNAAKACGADIVELHTGAYAEGKQGELSRLQHAATHAHAMGLEAHAGHGLAYDNVRAIAQIPELRELNIGHFLIGEAVFVGLGPAIAQMRRHIDEARA
jgi:pyridoxine 5-phosphate synthase